MTPSDFLHLIVELSAIIVTLWIFRQSAKKDAERKHEENRQAIQTTLDNQKEILDKIQTEQEFLPQHWHTEHGSHSDHPLTAGGILRRPPMK